MLGPVTVQHGIVGPRHYPCAEEADLAAGQLHTLAISPELQLLVAAPLQAEAAGAMMLLVESCLTSRFHRRISWTCCDFVQVLRLVRKDGAVQRARGQRRSMLQVDETSFVEKDSGSR